ncbi:MAG: hypothetical protein IPN34_04055 [Planctomycetes bacterium]|nr:hypothetical protein [Planctomycetota bacterium]
MLLILILIFLTRGGKSKPPEPEETARIQRPAPPPVEQDPFAEIRASIESAAVPVAQSFLEKLSAKDTGGVRALLEFPQFHENEARRLEAEGKAYEAWATLSAERQQEYKDGLVKRLIPSESSLKSWRLDTMVLDSFRPEAKFLDSGEPDVTQRYRRLEILFKMRPAEGSQQKANLRTPIFVSLYRTGEEWSVADLCILLKGEKRFYAPNPASSEYQKFLANAPGGGQKVDLTGDIEDQLEGGPRRVRLEDGTVGLAAKPAPVAYLETTSAETRAKIEQLMATMLDPAQTTGWAAARDELLLLKRDAMPAALTQLARIYKQAVEEAKSSDLLDDQELDKLQKVTQLLMKMREEVYQQEYDSKVGFSRMEYAADEADRMRKDINKVAMFWFGWWHENQNVIPQGEPTTLRRPRNR